MARASPAVLSADPTTGGTQFGIDLPTRSDVVVEVFNIAGRLVRTLWDAPLQPGQHDILWDGRDARGNPVASGVYYLKQKTHAGEAEEKLVIIR